MHILLKHFTDVSIDVSDIIAWSITYYFGIVQSLWQLHTTLMIIELYIIQKCDRVSLLWVQIISSVYSTIVLLYNY